jgi:hypothetical protein
MPITDAKDVAQQILTQLGAGFTVPTINLNDPAFALPTVVGNPLYGAVTPIDTDDLTVGVVGGSGTYDRLMTTHQAHLKEQYERGLITGDQYTKAYIELSTVAMQTGLQLLLQRDQSYWNALLIQAQARKAEVEAISATVAIQLAKIQLVMTQYQAQNAQAQYVLTLMQVAGEDTKYEVAHKQLLIMDEEILQAQKNLLLMDEQILSAQRQRLLLDEQITQAQRQILLMDEQITLEQIQQDINREQLEVQRAQTLNTRTDGTPVSGVVGVQRLYTLEQLEAQRAQTQDTRTDGSPVTGLVALQKASTTEQIALSQRQQLLVQEQVEAQRGQTSDTRTDGTPVVGLLGKQKDLYTQQIDSYRKDAEQKIAKMYLDGWITQKTLDDALLPPNQLTNAQIELVMNQVRLNNGL